MTLGQLHLFCDSSDLGSSLIAIETALCLAFSVLLACGDGSEGVAVILGAGSWGVASIYFVSPQPVLPPPCIINCLTLPIGHNTGFTYFFIRNHYYSSHSNCTIFLQLCKHLIKEKQPNHVCLYLFLM